MVSAGLICSPERLRWAPRWAHVERRSGAEAARCSAELAQAQAELAGLYAELDRLLAPYQERYGPIGGGGYPNPATEAFLVAFFARERALPPGVRRSWSWMLIRPTPPRTFHCRTSSSPRMLCCVADFSISK